MTRTRTDPDRLRRALPSAHVADVLPDRRPRLVAAQPFATSLDTSFSGTTDFLVSAGIAAGELEGGFTLADAGRAGLPLKLYAGVWKLGMRLARRHPGGFKLSPIGRRYAWRRLLPALADTDIVNNFQAFYPEFHAERRALGIRAFHYIDGTLHDLFEDYRDFESSAHDPRLGERLLAEEAANYRESDGIVTMSRHAADTLVDRYRIDPGKIHIVPPGANMDDRDLAGFTPSPPKPAGAPFVLGFVGVYPQRKGLDRLAGALAMLRGEGLDVRLRVIGKCPDEIAAQEGVEFVGYINKRSDPQAFLEAIRDVDLGCLLSRAELAGIAALEFLRLGIPVLGSGVGGMADILEGGGTITVENERPVADVAAAIRDCVLDRDQYLRLRNEAVGRIDWSRWERAVTTIGAVIADTGR